MNWRNHLHPNEVGIMNAMEDKRTDLQDQVAAVSKKIARLRNTCVKRMKAKERIA